MIGMLGFNMQAGFGSGILDRAMGMSGGMSMTAGLNIGGMGMSMGLGFGMDSSSFSPDAMMGGGSNFFHPLMSGGFGSPQCGSMNGMGMIPGMMNPGMMGMGGGQQMQMMQMMMQLMQMMMQMMQQNGMGGGMMGGMPGMMGNNMMGGGMPGFGMPGGFGSPMGMSMPGMGGGYGMPGMGGGYGMPGMGGGYGSPLGMNPYGGGGGYNGGGVNNAAPIGGSVTSPSGSGQAAVDLARRFTGQESYRIKGQMPHFTAAGGKTNNCADFVSSALESAGRLSGHHVNVRELEQSLIKQGYRQVPANQAQPGDVWINHSRGHTELVTQAGGTRTIGSNNDRPGHQVISERAKNTGSGVYYHKG